VDHGADINKESYVNKFLKFSYNEEVEVSRGQTPLFFACQEGHENIVKYLVEHGADINKEYNTEGYIGRFEREIFLEDYNITTYGQTPLFIACKKGHINIVKYLAEHGADINKETYAKYILWTFDTGEEVSRGLTPLFFACQEGHENIVKYLVDHGADINKEYYVINFLEEFFNREECRGQTPLFLACQKGYENIVKYLVERGANINKKDNNGITPLYIACENGYIAIVKYLVEHGANINKKDNISKTPLYIALENGYDAIVEYLVEHGADNLFTTKSLLYSKYYFPNFPNFYH